MKEDIENLIEELTKVRPEMLNEEALKLFNTIMAILDERDRLRARNKLLEHRLEVANEYIESRINNMIPEHYDDLKYILNECDLSSSW